MAAISFQGLASGLDSGAIIQSLVGVERIPKQRLEQQNQQYQSKIGIINNLSSALASLRTAAQDLDTSGEFLSFKGSISNDSIAKVTASGSSVPGSYKLEVTSLAQAQRTYSNSFAAKDTAVSATAQTLDITIGGNTKQIAIDADATLEDIAAEINGADAGVSAGIFFDGSNYRLQVVGTSTGADNAVTFADSGLGLGLETPANTVQAATDAVFKLDGFEVKSSTNLVNDVIPGTTLELKQTTTSAVDLNISADRDAVKEKVQKFVTAYNSVFSIINAQIGQGKGAETLSGDSTVRTIEQGLARMISGAIPGLSSDGNTMQLGDIGIKTNRDGTLTLDATKLDEVLSDGFTDAARYFAGDSTSGTKGMGALMDDLIETYTSSTDGLLTARKNGLDSAISRNKEKMSEMDRYLEKYEESLRQQFSSLETIMSSLQTQQAYLARIMNR